MTRTWLLWGLAVGGLRRTPLRVALTALGVAIAGGAMFVMIGFAIGLQRIAESPFEKFQLLNNIQVWPPGVDSDDGFGPPGAHGRPPTETETSSPSQDVTEPNEEASPGAAPVLDDAALARFAAIRGVEAAYPDLRSKDVRLVHGEKEQQTIAVGIPREVSILGMYDDMIVAGRFFSPEAKPEIVISDSLAQHLGFDSPQAAVGQTITVRASGLSFTADTSFAFQQEEFPVEIVGVHAGRGLGPRIFAQAVVFPVDQMQRIPGIQLRSALAALRADRDAEVSGYSRAVVRVESPSRVAVVEAELRAMGFETRSMLEQLDEMRTFFVFVDVLLAAVGAVACLVAALGIVNTLLMAVLERYREIGIYKAIGASRGDLITMFLTEAALIGLIGGIAGVALGYAVSGVLNLVINRYAQTQGVAVAFSMFGFPAWLIVSTVAFTVIMSMAAGIYPALRAASIDPIQAIRKE